MPPKVSDKINRSNEAMHALEAQTAADAQKVIATYAEDLYDSALLMSMLGVAPKEFSMALYTEELKAEEPEPPKKATKRAAKKATKKAAAKKATKKAAAKKATKKAAAKKVTKKAAAKKATS